MNTDTFNAMTFTTAYPSKRWRADFFFLYIFLFIIIFTYIYIYIT